MNTKIRHNEYVIVIGKWDTNVYEPTTGGYFSRDHSSLHNIDGTIYGDLMSRTFVADLAALPYGSDARRAAVDAHYAELRALKAQIIAVATEVIL